MTCYKFESEGKHGIYLQKGRLGEGAFGQVYLVAEERTQKKYAVKVINTHRRDLLQSAQREVQQLTEANHANIIQIFAAKQDGCQVHILLEYCPGGSLDLMLKPNMYTTIEQEKKWALQVTGAITYLHARNIVHRDLKPQNVLLTANDDAKVADFGLARPFMTGPNWQQTYREYYNMQPTAGISSYIAPEVWEGRYTEKADVYSIGVLLLVMFGRKAIPHFYTRATEDPHAMAEHISTDGEFNKKMKKLVKDMLSYKPQERPLAFEAYESILAFPQGTWWDWFSNGCLIS